MSYPPNQGSPLYGGARESTIDSRGNQLTREAPTQPGFLHGQQPTYGGRQSINDSMEVSAHAISSGPARIPATTTRPIPASSLPDAAITASPRLHPIEFATIRLRAILSATAECISPTGWLWRPYNSDISSRCLPPVWGFLGLAIYERANSLHRHDMAPWPSCCQMLPKQQICFVGP